MLGTEQSGEREPDDNAGNRREQVTANQEAVTKASEMVEERPQSQQHAQVPPPSSEAPSAFAKAASSVQGHSVGPTFLQMKQLTAQILVFNSIWHEKEPDFEFLGFSIANLPLVPPHRPDQRQPKVKLPEVVTKKPRQKRTSKAAATVDAATTSQGNGERVLWMQAPTFVHYSTMTMAPTPPAAPQTTSTPTMAAAPSVAPQITPTPTKPRGPRGRKPAQNSSPATPVPSAQVRQRATPTTPTVPAPRSRGKASVQTSSFAAQGAGVAPPTFSPRLRLLPQGSSPAFGSVLPPAPSCEVRAESSFFRSSPSPFGSVPCSEVPPFRVCPHISTSAVDAYPAQEFTAFGDEDVLPLQGEPEIAAATPASPAARLPSDTPRNFMPSTLCLQAQTSDEARTSFMPRTTLCVTARQTDDSAFYNQLELPQIRTYERQYTTTDLWIDVEQQKTFLAQQVWLNKVKKTEEILASRRRELTAIVRSEGDSSPENLINLKKMDVLPIQQEIRREVLQDFFDPPVPVANRSCAVDHHKFLGGKYDELENEGHLAMHKDSSESGTPSKLADQPSPSTGGRREFSRRKNPREHEDFGQTSRARRSLLRKMKPVEEPMAKITSQPIEDAALRCIRRSRKRAHEVRGPFDFPVLKKPRTMKFADQVCENAPVEEITMLEDLSLGFVY